jgi:virginiamycin B lyase
MLLFAASLSACGGGGSHALPHAVATSSALPAGKSRANFTIKIPPPAKSASALLARKAPQAAGRRTPAYISSATKSVSITIAGTTTNINTAMGSPGCVSDYTQPSITEVAVGSEPRGIIAGADGLPYFVEDSGGGLGKIGLGFTFSDYSTGVLQNDLIIGPDGYFWIGDVYTYAIGHVAADRSTYGSFSLPFDVGHLANASDGSVWVIPATSGGNQAYNVNGDGTYSGTQIATMYAPQSLTTGPDHNIYVAEGGAAGAIAKIEKIAGTWTLDFEVATPVSLGAITAGSDGNLWTTDGNGFVYKMTTAGVLTQMGTISSFANGLVTGPDGGLWGAIYNNGTVAHIDITDGTSHEYAVPAGSGSQPWSITAGTDGSLYFTERSTNKVGRLSFPAACTGTIVAPIGASSATMTTYDTTGGASGGGSKLSTETIPITISAGSTTNLAFTLDGIAASASLQLSGTNNTTGCGPGTQALALQVFDADQNLIVGAGNYVDANGSPLTFTLSTDDSSGHTTITNNGVTAPASAQPGLAWSSGSFNYQNISTTVTGGTFATPVAPLSLGAGCT